MANRQPTGTEIQDVKQGTFQVDSINGVSPTSNADLYDKMVAIIE